MVAGVTSEIEVDLGPGLIELERVCARYPCLLSSAARDGLELRGTLPILEGGREVDAFKIRLHLRREGTLFVPTVFEIGQRIPRDINRHVNPNDGSACVGLPEDLCVASRGGPMMLSAFMDGPVRDYFLAQAVFEREGRWPFGERGHGDAGVVEFYRELFGTRDAVVIDKYLVMLSAPRLHRQWFCPCGSGQKLRRCHGTQLESLRHRVAPAAAVRLRARLTAMIARERPSRSAK